MSSRFLWFGCLPGWASTWILLLLQVGISPTLVLLGDWMTTRILVLPVDSSLYPGAHPGPLAHPDADGVPSLVTVWCLGSPASLIVWVVFLLPSWFWCFFGPLSCLALPLGVHQYPWLYPDLQSIRFRICVLVRFQPILWTFTRCLFSGPYRIPGLYRPGPIRICSSIRIL